MRSTFSKENAQPEKKPFFYMRPIVRLKERRNKYTRRYIGKKCFLFILKYYIRFSVFDFTSNFVPACGIASQADACKRKMLRIFYYSQLSAPHKRGKMSDIFNMPVRYFSLYICMYVWCCAEYYICVYVCIYIAFGYYISKCILYKWETFL